MNAECYGHVFEVKGRKYYRCFLDGKITKVAPKKGDPCCVCDRPADPDTAQVVSVKTIAQIDLGPIGIITVTLPVESKR